MTKTVLIVLAVIAGLLAFMFFGPLHPAPTPPARQVSVAGEFVVAQNGNRIASEDYTLVYTNKEGYILISQATLDTQKKTTLAQQYQLTPQFALSFYQLGINTQSASQIVSVQPRGGKLHMEIRPTAGTVRTLDVPRRGAFILDNNLVSQYQLLILAAEAEKLDRDFTAVVPQTLSVVQAHLDGPNQVTFASGDKKYTGKRYTLRLGTKQITIVTYKGYLVGLFNPAQGIAAYNRTMFPQGVQYTAVAELARQKAGV